MIRVSAGILQKDNKILIAQRPQNKNYGLLWEFPGGKREEGESGEEALIRELREELALSLKKENIRLIHTLENAQTGLILDFYLCADDDYQPVRLEHNDLRWIGKNELNAYPFAINDQRMLDSIDLALLFA